jgi:hypothetical protein
VLIVSNPRFPNAVRDAANRARLVASALTPEVGRHVLIPLVSGEQSGQSYAIFPRLETMQGNKYCRLLQKRLVSKKLCTWLGDIGLETRRSCETDQDKEALFLSPLAFLIDDTDMPGEIRAFARTCCKAVRDGSVDLCTVVEHGDFWIGNILYPRSKLRFLGALQTDFFVIDWGGSRMAGYAGIDIVRYCISAFRPGSSFSESQVQAYMSTLGLSRFQLALFCVSSLGALGLNLDQFPKARYLELSESVFGFLKSYEFVE